MEYKFLLAVIVSITACFCSECPHDKFKMRIGGTCETSSCLGECFSVFTCCVDMCFSLNMTGSLVENCNIDQSTSTKSCSQHSEEVACIANITDSSPTICHEQLRWMKLQGMASFAPDIIEECPCEHGYNRLENACLFSLCMNSTDCINMTDTFHNDSVCCFGDYLKPKDEICGTGKEITSIVVLENGTDCVNICQSTNTTCITSEGVFPACCGDKPVQPILTKKNSIFEGADGVVVALIITFSLTAAASIVFLVLFFFKRKQAQHVKRQSMDKEKVLELDTIEEETNENRWTNIFDDFDVDDIERSITDDLEQPSPTVQITADVNVDLDSQRADNPVKEETSETNESSVNTTLDMPEDSNHKEEQSLDSASVTGDLNEINEPEYCNGASCIYRSKSESSETETNTVEMEPSTVSSTTFSQSSSTAELVHQPSDSDSICSFNSYLEGELRFYQSTRLSFDFGSRKRKRSTTPLTLTVSIGDTLQDETEKGFADIC